MWIFIISMAAIVYGGVLYFGYRSEKKLWNQGYCLECGGEWVNFDTDSQGGRGYKCGCPKNHTIWITWKRIDN